MNRSVALRSSVIFMIVMGLAATAGISTQTEVAEALFLISGALCAVMLMFSFAVATPSYAPVPVRIRRRI